MTWAKGQRLSSISSGQNTETMLLANILIILKMQWCFVNNGGIIFKSELGPRDKTTLASSVVKMLKQCYWQIF